jgi:hypothetical protein
LSFDLKLIAAQSSSGGSGWSKYNSLDVPMTSDKFRARVDARRFFAAATD